jgi:hypothetical protein
VALVVVVMVLIAQILQQHLELQILVVVAADMV